MNCRKCGHIINDSAQYCDNCGEKVIVVKQKSYDEKYRENKSKQRSDVNKKMEKHKDEKNPYILAALFATSVSLICTFFPWNIIKAGIGMSLPMRIIIVIFALLGDYHSTKAKQVNNLIYSQYGFRIKPNVVKIVNYLSILATIMGLYALFLYE